jgi:hypothetical protein
VFVALCAGIGYRQPKRSRNARPLFGAPQAVAVRDMLQPRATPVHGPGIPFVAIRPQQTTPTTTRAANLPTSYTVRGSLPTTPMTDVERAQVLAELEQDVTCRSSARIKDSNWRTWQLFHDRWFGCTGEYIPLTPINIAAVAGQMKSRRYRSFPGFLSSARDKHVEAGHAWTDELERARRRYTASTQRGIGPARQSVEVCPMKVAALALNFEALHDDGPICPKQWAVLCAFHMLRGAESSSSLASALTLNIHERKETLVLPKSKTDVQAVGCRRTWGCVCEGVCLGANALCPYGAAVTLKHELVRRFGDAQGRLPTGLPLFPTALGDSCTRDGYVATITHFSDALTINVVDDLGRNTVGEHVWRVSGSRLLARAAVPMTQIALMARWGSDIILRYVAETPLETITQSFASSSSAVPLCTRYTAASVVMPSDNDDVELALRCTDTDSEDESKPSSFAVHDQSGTMHMMAQTAADGTTTKTLCGRQTTNVAYSMLCSYTDSFVYRGALRPTRHCTQCASQTAWDAIVHAEHDL